MTGVRRHIHIPLAGSLLVVVVAAAVVAGPLMCDFEIAKRRKQHWTRSGTCDVLKTANAGDESERFGAYLDTNHLTDVGRATSVPRSGCRKNSG